MYAQFDLLSFVSGFHILGITIAAMSQLGVSSVGYGYNGLQRSYTVIAIVQERWLLSVNALQCNFLIFFNSDGTSYKLALLIPPLRLMISLHVA